MSHVVAGNVVCTDLEVLRMALKKFPKLGWRDQQKTYAWWGKWEADYAKNDAAYKNGIDVEDYGKSEHAIHMSGVDYEIGVVKRKDGQGYSLVWDFFADGKKISDYIGDSAEKLMTEYNKCYCETYAQAQGMMTQLTEDDECIQIDMFT